MTKTKSPIIRILLSALCLVSVNLFADPAPDHQLVERYSDKVILRPGIMPVGIINVETDVTIKTKKFDHQDRTRSTNLTVTSQFGIVNGVHGEVSYEGGFPFTSSAIDPITNKVNIGGRYNYFGLDFVSFNLNAKLPMHINAGEIVRDITIGLPTTFYNDLMAGQILGDLFTITMRPHCALGMDFPWWYGIQVYGNLWAMVNSSFGNVQMHNQDKQAKWTGTPFWKELPATLSATYVITHHFDVGASFGFGDVMKAADTIKFGINFAIRGGKIFG